VSTGRLEAFSDGVFAVAITLLSLNLHIPGQAGHSLAHNLISQWPEYAAYAVSFITIGIIWINHHAMIGRLEVADHAILLLNLVLLLTIVVIPFATSLIAEYLGKHGDVAAAVVYSGTFTAMAATFGTLQRHILLKKADLLREQRPLIERRMIMRRSLAGIGPYVVATLIALVSPYASLAINAALALFYALPVASNAGR
jgi:uncharacterized membrane protein